MDLSARYLMNPPNRHLMNPPNPPTRHLMDSPTADPLIRDSAEEFGQLEPSRLEYGDLGLQRT